jgi:hypothetical protein
MRVITDPNYLNVAGLVFDIAGASLLAKSIFFNPAAGIAAQAQPTWDDNYGLRLALCEQRVDAWFGLPLLVVGFFVQLASDFVSIDGGSAAFTGLLAILIVAIYFLFKRRLVEYSLSKSKPQDGDAK